MAVTAACFSVVDQCQGMSELCVEPLWYGEHANAIARQLDFCYIFIWKYVQSFKYNIIYRWIYHNKGKSIFDSMPKNLAWTRQQVDSITSQVVVYAPDERAEKLLLFLLCPYLLCGIASPPSSLSYVDSIPHPNPNRSTCMPVVKQLEASVAHWTHWDTLALKILSFVLDSRPAGL